MRTREQIDTTLPPPPGWPGPRHAPRNGYDVTDAVYNTRSSIRRVPEHHMVPAEVCDGHTDSLQGVVRGVVTTKMVVTTQGGVVTTLARGL
jgi:hypothetical protein